MRTSHQRILDLAAKHCLIRARDLAEHGLPSIVLTRMVRQGLPNRVSRRVYAIPGRPKSEHASLAKVTLTNPQAIV